MNVEDYVSINRKVLHIIGVYPSNKIRSFFCVFCMISIVIPQIARIYQDWNDLGIVLEVSSVLLMMLLGMLKTFACILNSHNLEALINFLLTDFWQSAARNPFYRHMEQYAKRARNITKGYLFLIFNALLVFYSLPLLEILILKYKGMLENDSKHFPFIALYPASFYESPLYELIFISQIMASISCGLIVLATDSLIATALIHTSGHFCILQQNLKNVDTSLNVVYQLQYQWKMSQNVIKRIKYELKQSIKYHHVILWFCEIMEKNFSVILLLQTISSSLIICLVGVQVSTSGLTNSTKLMKYFSYLIMALFQLLLFCFPGDELIYESSMVSKTAYSIEWYQSSVPIRTEISMIIMRSQKPSYITAGKFYVMHLENFNAILSTSLSYFMVLQNFNVENNRA